MRDLSFFLRLHSSAPLARFHRASLKPYLPLKVRYVLHPKGEIFLRINISERICWNQNRAIGRIDAPRDYVPVPLIEKLCRRGLACHYLASRYCNLSDFTFRGEEKREEAGNVHPAKRRKPHISSAALSALLLFGGYWLSNIEISREVFWILFLLISWLGGTFMIFTIIIHISVGLGVQPSSSMFLFPDASAEYKSYATQPVDTTRNSSQPNHCRSASSTRLTASHAPSNTKTPTTSFRWSGSNNLFTERQKKEG